MSRPMPSSVKKRKYTYTVKEYKYRRFIKWERRLVEKDVATYESKEEAESHWKQLMENEGKGRRKSFHTLATNEVKDESGQT